MTTIQKNIRITRTLNNQIKKYAEINSITETEFLTQAIEEKLSRKKIEDNEIFRIFRQIDKLNVMDIHNSIKEMITEKIIVTNLLQEIIEEQRSSKDMQKEINEFIRTLRIRQKQPQESQTETDANLEKCPRCNSVIKPWAFMIEFNADKQNATHLACTNIKCNFAKPLPH
jgi:hypothetical protein